MTNSSAKVFLKVIDGPGPKRTISFDAHQSLVIGRSDEAQLRISGDRKCSRFHTRFEINPPRCTVIDLDSHNGTYVNGQKIASPTPLTQGDIVRIGDTAIEVSIHELDHQESAAEVEETFVGMPSDTQPVLPGLQLMGEIGKGGMGTVYRAVQVANGRDVAVKILHPSTGSGDGLQQFMREASITMQLDHPQIVKTLEFGIHDHAPFLVMEFIDEVDVWKVLNTSSFTARMKVACGIVCRVLKGLEYAHSQHLVHRDVKPGNILTYMSGGKLQAKLTDFGLAKNFMNAGMSEMSTSRDVKGTLAYMPPEQILDCRNSKPCVDVYSAGACLYHLISGFPPYDIKDAASGLSKILNEPPIPITHRCTGVPTKLVEIINKSMARTISDRYASAKEFHCDLVPFSKRTAYEAPAT